MENNPLVSIIIPLYNAEKFIDECLKSCVAQTYPNVEIVIINDGSTDGCGAIANRYAENDKRVNYFTQENKGVARTRIAGIEASHGEYITWVDSDDFIAENTIERMVTEAIRSDADMVFIDFYRLMSDGSKIEHRINPKKTVIKNGIDFLETEDTKNYMCGKLYRREVSLNLVPQTVNVCDDYYFNLQILPKCKKVAYLNLHMYFYRCNPDSIMNDHSKLARNQYLEHAIQRTELIERGEYTEKIKENVLYDNIRILHGCFTYFKYNERVKKLTDATFLDYRYYLKDYKHFKMGLFLAMAELVSHTAYFIHKLNGTK